MDPTEPPVVNETVNGTTGRIPATPEGMITAYASLILMSLVPILVGSLQSVKFQQNQKETGEKPETMTHRDAAMFPLYASCALFGLYLFFMAFSKEYINMLLTVYFFGLGVLALTHVLEPVLAKRIMPAIVPFREYHLRFTSQAEPEGEAQEMADLKFNNGTLVCALLSMLVGVWYIRQKHWVANNILGMAFATNGVEILQINSVVTGCILLGGLFIYDIFWVFGTNVMVTVAKSFEAPVKLVFPQDLWENGLNSSNFAMLGLGDIVIPGIFIALLLRFDRTHGSGKPVYFISTFTAYFLGLLTTVFVMHVFKHAQPALLYLVPACLGTPFIVALVRGELGPLLHYKDHEEEELKEKEEPRQLRSSVKKED